MWQKEKAMTVDRYSQEVLAPVIGTYDVLVQTQIMRLDQYWIGQPTGEMETLETCTYYMCEVQMPDGTTKVAWVYNPEYLGLGALFGLADNLEAAQEIVRAQKAKRYISRTYGHRNKTIEVEFVPVEGKFSTIMISLWTAQMSAGFMAALARAGAIKAYFGDKTPSKDGVLSTPNPDVEIPEMEGKPRNWYISHVGVGQLK